MQPKHTTESFIAAAKERRAFSDFDYSRVEYIDAHTPVEIGCPKCKRFFKIRPAMLIRGKNCTLCGADNRRRTMGKSIKQ